MLQSARKHNQGSGPGIDLSAITMPDPEVADDSLVLQVRGGDRNAYGRIMRRYNQRLYRIARSILGVDADALDTVQDAYIKAYEKIDSYRGGDKLCVWLSTIVRNEALMRLRKQRREVDMTDEQLTTLQAAQNVEQIHTVSSDPELCLENMEIRTLINKHLDSLPANFRTVFVLRAVEQMSVRETAEILAIKEETVKTRFFRARRMLREQLQAYLEEAGLHVYEVGGRHCDAIIQNVLTRLGGGS